MSTEIKIIKGREELIKNRVVGDVEKYSDCYTDSYLYINRFFGQIENEKAGPMIQLSIEGSEFSYIQLTKKQTINLGITLLKAFDYKLYPNE